ncbi:MAG: hypothetical protein ACJ8LG_03550 [Massilia sp.]
MKLTRSSRFIAAAITLFCILFMQLAVAAYACPALGLDRGSQAMEASAGMPAAEMSGCHDMDPVQPSLCHASGQAGAQSLDKPAVPHLQPFMAVGFGLPVSPLEVTYPAAFTLPRTPLLTRATAPPVAIRNCCFRI